VRCPACLPELAFITADPAVHPDVRILREQRQKMANALCAGIMAFFGEDARRDITDTPHDEISLNTLESETNEIQMTVSLEINGVRHENVGGIVGGRTFTPARLVAEALGADVDWDDATRSVIVTGGGRK